MLSTATIRAPRLEEIPELVGCLLRLWEDTDWHRMPFVPDTTYLAAWIIATLKSNPSYACFVAEDEGRLIGVCGVQLTVHPLVPTMPYLEEWALWVSARYRGGSVTRHLWRAASRWAKDRGARGRMRHRSTWRAL